jgi:hypothetical protein
MRPITVTVGPLATASANALALSQTPGAAGALTLNGALATSGVVKMDAPRRVLITAAANETANTFTITGSNWSGQIISEVITGPNAATAQSVLDYSTVTSIVISAAASGTLTVGTSSVASSPWIRMDDWAFPQVAIQASVTGTVNYTIQQTLQDPNSPYTPILPAALQWVNSSDPTVVNATVTAQTSYAYSPAYVRITLNSGTGSVAATITQFSVVPI